MQLFQAGAMACSLALRGKALASVVDVILTDSFGRLRLTRKELAGAASP